MTAFGSTRSSLDDVIALELEVQTSQCRADPPRVQELLAEDFLEIGASGRRWDLASTLEMLRWESQDPSTTEIEVADIRARQIAPGVVQILWTSSRSGQRARRSSIWCLRDAGWRLVFHQGTPAAIEARP